jgi:hypothetical protein
MKTIKEAVAEGIKLWITNWEWLDKPITWDRVVTMIIRAMDIVKEQIWAKQ